MQVVQHMPIVSGIEDREINRGFHDDKVYRQYYYYYYWWNKKCLTVLSFAQNTK